MAKIIQNVHGPPMCDVLSATKLGLPKGHLRQWRSQDFRQGWAKLSGAQGDLRGAEVTLSKTGNSPYLTH